MIENKLSELLRSVHAELAKGDDLDPQNRDALQSLIDEIQDILDDTKPNTEQDDSFIERLEDGLTRFEVTHPELVGTINKVLESLSNAGI